jgi:leader peptidase (prepilin peptidase)/N-methyltransferase
MSFVIYGFIFGCFIPYLARHIGKLMPATMGYILLKVLIPYHCMPWSKLKDNPQYMVLFNRYLMRSLGWGIFTAAASYLFSICFDNGFIVWYIAFLWILLLLVEIDKRFLLLPDIFTYPLLILGFTYAALNGDWLITNTPDFIGNPLNSAIGAALGYIMPVAASLFLVLKKPDAFGGGDIKLLSAIGAWVGFEAISYILLLSCGLFGLECLISRQRVGPFGPAIVYATLIICIFLFGI